MKLSAAFPYKVALAVVVLAGAGYILFRGSRLAMDAAQAVNPFNNDNIINQGATSIYQGMTGSTGTIGTDIYDGVQAVKGRIDAVNDAMREEGFGWPI